jgi:hypothetical protein
VAAFANWPVVVLVFGIVFIFAFYGPIGRFLDRASRIGPQGVETGSATAQEKSLQREQTSESLSSQADEFLRLFDSKMLLEAEGAVRADLAKRNITNPGERERVLVRLVAAAGAGFVFERIYNQIFGSQIKALQALNASALPRDGIEPFYRAAKAENPNFYSNYSFDQWFNFMVSHTLIAMMDGNTVGITVRGREFLKFLIQEAHILNKAG